MISRVVSKLSFLGVLLYRRVRLVGGHLHLRTRLLGDLHHEVEDPVAQVQGHIVPRRDLLAGAVQEEDPVVEGLRLALVLGLDVGLVEGGRGDEAAPVIE